MSPRLQAVLILLLAIGMQVGVGYLRPDLSVVAGTLAVVVQSLLRSVLGEDQKPEDK